MNKIRQIIYIDHPIRLRVRRVNEFAIIKEAIKKASELKCAYIVVNNGGSVSNNYGYPADTEGVICVGFMNGDSWTKVVRLPANKVSHSGVFNKVWKRGLFDRRFSSNKMEQVKREFLAYVRAELSQIVVD